MPVSRHKDTAVLLVHGKDERTIPSTASSTAAAQLKTAGFKVELDIEPGVGHTISTTGAQKALAFLRKTFRRNQMVGAAATEMIGAQEAASNPVSAPTDAAADDIDF